MKREELIKSLDMDVQKFRKLSYLFPNLDALTLYLRELQWVRVPQKTYLNHLESSFEDYQKKRKKIFNLVLHEEKQDKRVKPALEIVSRVIQSYAQQLKNMKVVGLLYGSFYFGDPSKNPDIDLDFLIATKHENPKKVLEKMISEIENLKMFKKPSACDVIDLKEYEKQLNNLTAGNYNEVLDYEDLSAYTGIILTSKKIYPPSSDVNYMQRRIERLQETIEEVIRKNPALRAMMITRFITIEHNRKDRRNGTSY